MPDRTRPPYRADHIGSLKRPGDLLQAHLDIEAGKISKDKLTEIENEAIKSAISLQKRLGIKAITDGEFRRRVFYEGFFEKLEGIEFKHGLPTSIVRPFIPFTVAWDNPIIAVLPLVVAPLRRTSPLYVSEFEAMKFLVDKDDIPNIKITMCSPIWYDMRLGKNWVIGGYKSRAELFKDLSSIYREELADLYAAGCRNVQIDEPTFTFFCHKPVIEGYKQHESLDPEQVLLEYIDLFNDCLRDVPKDMVVGIHLCRGNHRGNAMVEGAYDPIAEHLFTKLNVDCFYLEYDTSHAGGFEPLVHLPRDKLAVLGLVSSKKPELESLDLLISRVNEAAKIMSDKHKDRSFEECLNQFCLSPQCGFSSDCVGNPITEEDMEKKLKLVCDVAQRVWK